MSKCEGVPDNVTLAFAKDWVRSRVSDKRFKHIEGVAEVAERLAKKAGLDPFAAALAGFLHDACKEMKPAELIERAKQYYLALDPILEQNGHLLHGPVSAEVAKRELGIGNREILDAIAQHTLGAVDMAPLSKVLFLADCLDSTRPESYTKPIWEALDIDGAFEMDAAVVVATDEGLKFLIEDKKPIHPKTIAVRNHYLHALRKKAAVG